MNASQGFTASLSSKASALCKALESTKFRKPLHPAAVTAPMYTCTTQAELSTMCNSILIREHNSHSVFIAYLHSLQEDLHSICIVLSIFYFVISL